MTLLPAVITIVERVFWSSFVGPMMSRCRNALGLLRTYHGDLMCGRTLLCILHPGTRIRQELQCSWMGSRSGSRSSLFPRMPTAHGYIMVYHAFAPPFFLGLDVHLLGLVHCWLYFAIVAAVTFALVSTHQCVWFTCWSLFWSCGC